MEINKLRAEQKTKILYQLIFLLIILTTRVVHDNILVLIQKF
nr:MAG TPA: hypothetical protein [Caudoviricetes sp.]